MNKLIIIGGATASGKTSLSIQLALHFNTEIISADSRQCYREMNIGVAKPSNEELNQVPHHFINSHSIHENITAGDFERYALQKLDNIFQKNEVAICVGGTGLYIKALCEGIDEMPQVNNHISNEVNKQYQHLGIEWLQNELKKEDPLFYNSSEIENPMRMLRALIFKKSIGQSIKSFRTNKSKIRPFEIKKYAIEMPREQLYERINQRVENMIDDGLLNEVESLIPYKNQKNLQTVGYTELFDYFNQEMKLNEAIEKIKQHSRNYAKRQITWFKNQSNYEWIQSITDIV